MTRTLAFVAALLLTTVTVTGSCFAHPSVEDIRFTLTPSHKAGQVSLALRSGPDRHNNNMSSSFAAGELSGLDVARLHAGGPVSFALIREAGRVDCAGTAASARAEGSCRFSEDPSFAAFLASNGMKRPTREESYVLTMVEARRDLVQALKAANYAMPSVDDYIAMSAVGVTPSYIADLARAGYRPPETDDLIQFRALDVTPEYLGELSRAGYSKLPGDTVVQFAALKIDPAFITEVERMGYRNLPVDDLVQLKALNIDAEFIRGFERIGYRNLEIDELVQLKALNVTPEFVQSVRRNMMANASIDQVVQLKAMGLDPTEGRR